MLIFSKYRYWLCSVKGEYTVFLVVFYCSFKRENHISFKLLKLQL